MTGEAPPGTGEGPPPGAIVLFDGTCGFCEGSVRFIARRDPIGYFRFAPSQWPEAVALLTRRGVTRDAARSLVLIEGDRVYLRSTASLRIASHLTWPWRAAGVLLLVPEVLRDAVYRVVARVRHRLAGTSRACEIPPPEIRSRLIPAEDVRQEPDTTFSPHRSPACAADRRTSPAASPPSAGL